MKCGSSHSHTHGPAGFTLLELLVVLVIIGLLASYVGPKYFSQVGKAEAKIAKAQIEAFEKALGQYRLEVGRYPTTELGLDALVSRPANEPKWGGPYLAKGVPLDPWGNLGLDRAYRFREAGYLRCKERGNRQFLDRNIA